ncbi:MAG: DUF3572 domain-containing protein [Rhodobacteraceae bacterium]|nr:DUF3572 domain-containing protein [Paracoccaceae bacterium]
MKQEHAETLAIQALGWLANETERLEHFLNASGVSVDDLRNRAQEPEFLGFVLDFMLLDDKTILTFAEDTGNHPEDISQARFVLSGGLPNWT